MLFRSAYINDAAAIIEKAHKVGAYVVLDTRFQFRSAPMPVDVQNLMPDFACGGVLKWLCGGPGRRSLYVRPDLGKKLVPHAHRMDGAHQHPFDFEIGPDPLHGPALPLHERHAAHPGRSKRRDLVSPSSREAGVANIREKSKRQTAAPDGTGRPTWLARQHPARSRKRRGGIGVRSTCPTRSSQSQNCFAATFWSTGARRAGVRFSPHFYTKDEEIEELAHQCQRWMKS